MSKEFTIGGISYNIQEEKSIISSDGITEISFPKSEVPSGIKYVIAGDESKDPAKLVLIGVKDNLSVLMKGPKGTGKTTTAAWIAQELNRPLSYLQLTGATGVDSFVGKWLVNKDGTYWVDGILTRAMKYGYILVLDELNQALPEITSVLHSVMDERQILVLDEKGAGEVVKAHKDFRIIACINPTEDYAGNKEMNQALVDRFKIVLNVEYPDPRKEIEIVLANQRVKITDKTSDAVRKTSNGKYQKVKANDGIVTRMVTLANTMRKKFNENEFSFEISTRNLIDWACLCSHLPVKEAAQYSFINKMEIENKQKKFFNDELKRLFTDGELFRPTGVSVEEDISINNIQEDTVELEDINIASI